MCSDHPSDLLAVVSPLLAAASRGTGSAGLDNALNVTFELLKGHVMTLTTDGLRILERNLNKIMGWTDKAHVLKEAHTEIKTVVVSLFGEQPSGQRWRDVDPTAFRELPEHTLRAADAALQRLVIAYDNAVSSSNAGQATAGSTTGAPSATAAFSADYSQTIQEIVSNADYLLALAQAAAVARRRQQRPPSLIPTTPSRPSSTTSAAAASAAPASPGPLTPSVGSRVYAHGATAGAAAVTTASPAGVQRTPQPAMSRAPKGRGRGVAPTRE